MTVDCCYELSGLHTIARNCKKKLERKIPQIQTNNRNSGLKDIVCHR